MRVELRLINTPDGSHQLIQHLIRHFLIPIPTEFLQCPQCPLLNPRRPVPQTPLRCPIVSPARPVLQNCPAALMSRNLPTDLRPGRAPRPHLTLTPGGPLRRQQIHCRCGSPARVRREIPFSRHRNRDRHRHMVGHQASHQTLL